MNINKFKIFKQKLFGNKLSNLNIYLFLGFNLTLVSILGFVWFHSASNSLV